MELITEQRNQRLKNTFCENTTAPDQNSSTETDSNMNRISTAQRIRYEAEVDYIIKKFGTLEQMREKLGVTRRKMCEILLVDPSAWTRWTKSKGGPLSAPAHVYKTMSLILQKNETHTNDEHKVINDIKNMEQMTVHTIEKNKLYLENRLNSYIEKTETLINTKTDLRWVWKVLILIHFVSFIYFIAF